MDKITEKIISLCNTIEEDSIKPELRNQVRVDINVNSDDKFPAPPSNQSRDKSAITRAFSQMDVKVYGIKYIGWQGQGKDYRSSIYGVIIDKKYVDRAKDINAVDRILFFNRVY